MRTSTKVVVLGKKLWTPAQLTNSLFFDPTDISTLTVQASKVSNWRGKANSPIDLLAVIPADQPTYITSAFNGSGALSFDNISNSMVTSENALGTVTTFNAIALWQTNTNDATYDYLYQVGTTSNALSLSVAGVGASVFSGNYYHLDSASPPAAFDSGTSALFGQPVITSHSINPSSPTNALFVNGTQRTVNAWTKTLSSTGTLYLGFNNQGANRAHFLNGIIGGVIFVINAPLSTRDIQKAEGFLAHRQGVASILNNSHPFKFTPPYV
jgi:hypothetical protein